MQILYIFSDYFPISITKMSISEQTRNTRKVITRVIRRWINDPIHHVTRSYHGHAIYQTQFSPPQIRFQISRSRSLVTTGLPCDPYFFNDACERAPGIAISGRCLNTAWSRVEKLGENESILFFLFLFLFLPRDTYTLYQLHEKLKKRSRPPNLQDRWKKEKEFFSSPWKKPYLAYGL